MRAFLILLLQCACYRESRVVRALGRAADPRSRSAPGPRLRQAHQEDRVPGCLRGRKPVRFRQLLHGIPAINDVRGGSEQTNPTPAISLFPNTDNYADFNSYVVRAFFIFNACTNADAVAQDPESAKIVFNADFPEFIGASSCICSAPQNLSDRPLLQ